MLKSKLKENYLCKVCRKVRFKQRSPTHVICSYECATMDTLAKHQEMEDKRCKTRLKEITQDRSWWMKKAQATFNSYIRERDKDKLCICCDQPLNLLSNGYMPLGGLFDCGHYLSVGAAPHLRFNENNAHAQRKYCNNYLSGNHVKYRIGLIKRIGLEAVEELESDQTPKKYTKEDLKEVVNLYKRKIKELRAVTIEQYKEG